MASEFNVLDKLPRHVAIIMDGNGRWAEKRKLPRVAGHRAGVETVRKIVRLCGELKIEALTVFAFSSENWKRPKKEVSLLMELFLTALEKEIKKLHQNGVRVKVVGDTSVFQQKLQKSISNSEVLTANNVGLKLSIAANYGGHWDIMQATQKIADQVKSGNLEPDEITTDTIEQFMCFKDIPDPDLFIRTGGEQRISNFLNWQLSYTELYFTDVLWPDFDEQELFTAFQSYSNRQRRFGETGAQVVEKLNNA